MISIWVWIDYQDEYELTHSTTTFSNIQILSHPPGSLRHWSQARSLEDRHRLRSLILPCNSNTHVTILNPVRKPLESFEKRRRFSRCEIYGDHSIIMYGRIMDIKIIPSHLIFSNDLYCIIKPLLEYSFGYQILDTKHQTLNTGYHILDIRRHQIPDTRHQTPNTKHLIPS